MSKKHWTQRAARLIQGEHSVKYLATLNWVLTKKAQIEKKVSESAEKDEDGLRYGDRCVSEALDAYKARAATPKE